MKRILACLFLYAWANLCYALPFSIIPNGTLPTGVIYGGSVSAAYTVTNNTTRQLNNLYVNLPPNVTVASGGCGSLFNLAPGASCILNLTVSGHVVAADQNPASHLYVCLPGGLSCTGTNFPLNVQYLTAPSFGYVGSGVNIGGINLCTSTTDNGDLDSCSITGTGVSGTNVFQQAINITFSHSGLQAYVVDTGVAPAVIWVCNLNTTTGALTGCMNSGATGYTSPVNLVLNSTGNQAYITDAGGDRVILCTVNMVTGLMSACADSGAGAIFPEATDLAINPSNTLAYITSFSSGNIFRCGINATTGQLTTPCQAQTIFTAPWSILFTPQYNVNNVPTYFAYVTDTSANAVYFCTINPDNSLSCATTGTNNGAGGTYAFSQPTGMTLVSSRGMPNTVYVSNNGNGNVAVCNYCASGCSAGQNPGQLYCNNTSGATGLTDIIGVAYAS